MTHLTRLILSFSLLALPLPGATVLDAALGSSLAGATVTVTRSGGTMSTATFVAAGTGASAIAPGSAGFALTVSPGDTSGATWMLENTDPSLIILNRIVAVTIDLTLSGRALFDSGTAPSTPTSGPGLAGVAYVGGITIGSAGEFTLWADAANTGDLFRALTITFGGGFTAGATSSWMDDTDVIDLPEPSSGSMLALAALAALLSGRRLTRGRTGCRVPAAIADPAGS